MIRDMILLTLGIAAGTLGALGFLVELLTDAQWERDPLLLIIAGLLFVHLSQSGDHS